MRHLPLVITGFALAAAFGTNAHATIYTVGSGTGCTHGTIQSAIDAADASPGYDVIRLTRSLTYEPESNTVDTSDDLSIVGGFATCAQETSDGIHTVVSGFGASSSVFDITANGTAIIKLRHLHITNAASYGIHFRGSGTLQAIESTIDRNNVTGIRAEASAGSAAQLIIDTGTLILQNGLINSSIGGGVFLSGPITMTMIAPQTVIGLNNALVGGGLYVGSGASALIGSPGYGGLAAIYGNSSSGGGAGIFNTGTVKLFTTDPAKPVRVVGNSTPSAGGGIYTSGQDSWLCAHDFAIDDNHAGTSGGAIFADGGVFGQPPHVILNRDDEPGCTLPVGALRCAVGDACNSISGNTADHDDGAASSGSIIELESYVLFRADRVQMRGNTGFYAIHGIDSQMEIDHALIADNVIDGFLLVADGANTAFNALFLDHSTIAHNDIPDDFVLHSPNILGLSDDIIFQPGTPTFVVNPRVFNAQYLLVGSPLNLPSTPDIIVDYPMFVDPTHGDYHLARYSPAIDFAPRDDHDSLDFDRNPYDVDLPDMPNRFGPRDLGVYELQSAPTGCSIDPDTVFCTGFE
jgi:predicted outer membrane repeat protein